MVFNIAILVFFPYFNNPTINLALNYNLQSNQSLFWTRTLPNYVNLYDYGNNRLGRTNNWGGDFVATLLRCYTFCTFFIPRIVIYFL